MLIAGLQMDIAWEDPEENFRRARILAEQAATSGAELLVLPEMFATGFSMRAEEVAIHAEATQTFLCNLATELGVWVVGGYAEPGPERPLNACSVMAPDGSEHGRYHKIHPFSLAGEHEHFSAGRSLTTVDVEGLRLTPLICYDLRFPELFRIAAEATDLFVVIANWPVKRSRNWRLLLRARAIDAQAWVLGVNRVGTAEGYEHRGDSALVDPTGLVVASRAEQPGVLCAEVHAHAVREVRRRYRFLNDRQSEVYRSLEDGE